MKYSDLTNKQKSFIHHLFDMGNDDPTKTTFKRGELKTIAEQGGWAWAPAWIVKDKTRVVSRGTYNVPELADFIAEMQEDTVDIDAPDAISDFQAQVRESIETHGGMTSVTEARREAGHPDPGGLADVAEMNSI
tara:strand:- start:609 stop:1010 length:402 start_codon:yes stop_codon:yes gene_type:complete